MHQTVCVCTTALSPYLNVIKIHWSKKCIYRFPFCFCSVTWKLLNQCIQFPFLQASTCSKISSRCHILRQLSSFIHDFCILPPKTLQLLSVNHCEIVPVQCRVFPNYSAAVFNFGSILIELQSTSCLPDSQFTYHIQVVMHLLHLCFSLSDCA